MSSNSLIGIHSFNIKEEEERKKEEEILLKSFEEGYTMQNNSSIDELTVTVTKNKEIKSKRIYWIDWLRVYASFLVVYNHCSLINVPRVFREGNWYALYFHHGLSKICVPLFIMISGIFFLNPNKEISIKKLYTKYIYRMVKCLYFWSFICNIIDIIIMHNENSVYDKVFFKNTIINILGGRGHFWYLYFVIGLYMTTPFYRAIIGCDKDLACYCAGINFLCGQFLPTFKEFLRKVIKIGSYLLDIIHISFGQGIEITGGMATYYFFGYLLNAHNFENNKLHRWFFYILGIVGVILTIALRYVSSFNEGKEDESFGKYESFNVAFYTYGVFIFFKCELNRWIQCFSENKLFIKFTKICSECSFGVYLLHMTVYNLYVKFGFTPQQFNPWFFIPIYTTIVYITTFIIVIILRKILFFRNLL